MPSPLRSGASVLLCCALVLMMDSGLGRAVSIRSWSDCTTYTAELNRLARQLAAKVSSDSQSGVADKEDDIPLVEESDKCDPLGLSSDPEPCLTKIADALQNYSRLFGKNGLFEGSSWEEVEEVSAVIENLRRFLGVSVLHIMSHSRDSPGPVLEVGDKWMCGYLQRYTVERLLSFSAIAARVFAIGDPSKHGEAGSSPHCATL
ncbi:interleukin-23 subunit alpha-like [Amia ocellicauda]|uniref:interleukin-23 subunit alpha-like n=1 Tax=Amia ocellicauda TaxID=2972642 RepID=UPI003463E3F3